MTALYSGAASSYDNSTELHAVSQNNTNEKLFLILKTSNYVEWT